MMTEAHSPSTALLDKQKESRQLRKKTTNIVGGLPINGGPIAVFPPVVFNAVNASYHEMK
jgi:hypothetical protein